MEIIQGNSRFRNTWAKEHDVEKWIKNLPEEMVKRDKQLERENAKKVRGEIVTGRKGNLKQWEIIVSFYAEYFGLNKSFYSGESLTTLKRAGLFMMSFQRSNDLLYYFENFLKWMLYICSSLEQRMFPRAICKKKEEKDMHLARIVTLWDEGRGAHETMPPSPIRYLNPETEVPIVLHRFNGQKSTRYGPGRQGDWEIFKNWSEHHFRSQTLWSLGNYEANNALSLSADSLVSGSAYDMIETPTYTSHYCEYWWMK